MRILQPLLRVMIGVGLLCLVGWLGYRNFYRLFYWLKDDVGIGAYALPALIVIFCMLLGLFPHFLDLVMELVTRVVGGGLFGSLGLSRNAGVTPLGRRLTSWLTAIGTGAAIGGLAWLLVGKWLAVLAIGGFIWAWRKGGRPLASRLTRPIRRHFRLRGFGAGGSARFAGLWTEWGMGYKAGQVLLGRSLYDGAVLGHADDRGLLTIASNRSGKGRSAIIPNLLAWPGSAVVIDPKGTNAAVTAARRGQGGGRVTEGMGQPVHVVDPFGIVAGVRRAAFNPLDSIEIASPTVKEDIGLLADALVVPTPEGMHWDEGSRTILAGLIAQLKSTLPYVSLLDVRGALVQDADHLDELFGKMIRNPAAGGLAKAAAALIMNAGQNERGSLFTNTLRNTNWLDSLAMQAVLAESDFSLQDLKATPTTVYVVLPPHLLDEHNRFMRLFVNMTIKAASRGGKSQVPILCIIDEFYSLGSLASLAKASGSLASYGLKLWPIIQNLSQLVELYPQNWQTFFANAGMVQIFSVNDRATAEEVIARMGPVVRMEQVDAQTVRSINKMIEAAELEEQVSREGGLQVIIRSGAQPLLLKRMPYDRDRMFSEEQFNPDPDHR